MITFSIAIFCGLGVGLGCYYGDVCGYGWSIFFGVLGFGVCQFGIGFFLRRKVKAQMDEVQRILTSGQKQLQMKTQRWQMKPPGSIQAAQMEIERDQRVFVKAALEAVEPMHKFDLWVPMMRRQIATAQFQLYWMIKDWKKVDELMPKAMFLDPGATAMKLARYQMQERPLDEMEKVYDKAVRRLRYNQNVLLAGTWSWILVKRGEIDRAFKALNAALKNSDNETLKANRDSLSNNRVQQFSNSGLGDQWYALQLEEPRIRQRRQRMQWR